MFRCTLSEQTKTIRDSRSKRIQLKAGFFCSLKMNSLTGALAILFFVSLVFPVFANEIPQNLWQGLIAEDTSGNLDTYRVIASVVRNRLKNGLSVGLVALNRKGLDGFIKRNRTYVLVKRGIDLKVLATQAIFEVFRQGKDYANGADHYEHTKIYPMPNHTKKMKVVKVLHSNTKSEITCWKR